MTFIPIVSGVVVLATMTLMELRHRAPLVDARLFKNSRFSVAVLALTLGTFSVYGFLYSSTFYLQVQRGYSPLITGVLLGPISLGIVIGGPLSRKFVAGIGSRGTVAAGMALVTTALIAAAFVGAHAPIFTFEIICFAIAFGFALVLAPGTAVAMSAIPAAEAGTGSALINTLRQLGSAMGVAILGSTLWSVYETQVRPHLDTLAPAVRDSSASTLAATLEAGQSNPGMSRAANDSFSSAMQVSSLIAAGIAGIATVSICLPRVWSRARHSSPIRTA